MPFGRNSPFENPRESQSRSPAFFYLSPSVTADEHLKLQEGIDKQKEYIAQLEEHKRPIEQEIEEKRIYKEKANALLIKIQAETAQLKAEISKDPSLQKKIRLQSAKYKACEARCQQMEGFITTLNERLNSIDKKIDEAKDGLNKLQERLSQAQEIKHGYFSVLPSTA